MLPRVTSIQPSGLIGVQSPQQLQQQKSPQQLHHLTLLLLSVAPTTCAVVCGTHAAVVACRPLGPPTGAFTHQWPCSHESYSQIWAAPHVQGLAATCQTYGSITHTSRVLSGTNLTHSSFMGVGPWWQGITGHTLL